MMSTKTQGPIFAHEINVVSSCVQFLFDTANPIRSSSKKYPLSIRSRDAEISASPGIGDNVDVQTATPIIEP